MQNGRRVKANERRLMRQRNRRQQPYRTREGLAQSHVSGGFSARIAHPRLKVGGLWTSDQQKPSLKPPEKWLRTRPFLTTERVKRVKRRYQVVPAGNALNDTVVDDKRVVVKPNVVHASDDDNNDDGVDLIVQFFRVRIDDECARAARQNEYDFCLRENIQHRCVRRVHVLLEDADVDQVALREALSDDIDPELIERKLNIVELGKRMHYADAFAYANKHLTGRIAVIVNGDIAIGQGVKDVWSRRNELFVDARRGGQQMLALTRHEWARCKHRVSETPRDPLLSCGCPFFKRLDQFILSHDSFWFVPPVPSRLIADVDHRQNIMGAEHAVITAAFECGMSVINPSRSVRTFHCHESDVRPWKLEMFGTRSIGHPRRHPDLPATTLDEHQPSASYDKQ